MTHRAPATGPRGDELESLAVHDPVAWREGPPHELFRRLRRGCPVHWSGRRPGAAPDGHWSVTTAEHVAAVSRDWRTFSSERGGVVLSSEVLPVELQRAMFIGMDPPKHDRLRMLFQAGFTPRRIAAQEPEVRRIVSRGLDMPVDDEVYDLVTDVAQPIVARVIGSFMGIPEEDDAAWAELMSAAVGADDPSLNPGGPGGVAGNVVPEVFERCRALIAERRARPTGDLTSVLVHAEIDGERLTETEIVMGVFLMLAAGNDSTKATYCSGMHALMEAPEQRRLLLEDSSLIPGAVEESLRMFPPFAHFSRTAMRDVELGGQQVRAGDRVVMWYVASNRDETVHEEPDRFDVRRRPDHQAFGGGGRHFCLGSALARLELRVLFEETLARFPKMELAGEPTRTRSVFVNQFRTLPVRLTPW